MISTKGRYSIRILLDLAENQTADYVPLKEIAARQDISLKYIEKVLPALKEGGLIDSIHGKGGGYRLIKSPDECTLWEILKLTEMDMAPVSCLKDDAEPCQRAGECRTLGIWKGYYDLTIDYFSKITLYDLMKNKPEIGYII